MQLNARNVIQGFGMQEEYGITATATVTANSNNKSQLAEQLQLPTTRDDEFVVVESGLKPDPGPGSVCY